MATLVTSKYEEDPIKIQGRIQSICQRGGTQDFFFFSKNERAMRARKFARKEIVFML